MKKKYNEGFTLVELLISIVILAAIVIPTCTSLTLSFRMNAKTNDMMQAQLAVSSAVEKLMAKGITDNFKETLADTDPDDGDEIWTSTEFPGLCFVLKDEGAYYAVTVMDEAGLVEVNTSIRDLTTTPEGGGTE